MRGLVFRVWESVFSVEGLGFKLTRCILLEGGVGNTVKLRMAPTTPSALGLDPKLCPPKLKTLNPLLLNLNKIKPASPTPIKKP